MNNYKTAQDWKNAGVKYNTRTQSGTSATTGNCTRFAKNSKHWTQFDSMYGYCKTKQDYIDWINIAVEHIEANKKPFCGIEPEALILSACVHCLTPDQTRKYHEFSNMIYNTKKSKAMVPELNALKIILETR